MKHTRAVVSLSELLRLLGMQFADFLYVVDHREMEHGLHWLYNGEQSVYTVAGLEVFAAAALRLAEDAAPQASPDDEVAARAQREACGRVYTLLRAEIARLEPIAAAERIAAEQDPQAYAAGAELRQRQSTPSRELAGVPWYQRGQFE